MTMPQAAGKNTSEFTAAETTTNLANNKTERSAFWGYFINSFVSSFRLMFYNLRCSRKFKSKQHIVVMQEKKTNKTFKKLYWSCHKIFALESQSLSFVHNHSAWNVFQGQQKQEQATLSDARVSAAPQSYTKIFETWKYSRSLTDLCIAS